MISMEMKYNDVDNDDVHVFTVSNRDEKKIYNTGGRGSEVDGPGGCGARVCALRGVPLSRVAISNWCCASR